MKAISMHQPWAQWVAEGFKTIETRTHPRFSVLLGQRIAIHATKTFDVHAVGLAGQYIGRAAREAAERGRGNLGVILCTAFVHHAAPLHPSSMRSREHSQAALIDCFENFRFGLFLKGIVILHPPIPWRGQQFIFDVPDDMV
jgi:hypothetical protein